MFRLTRILITVSMLTATIGLLSHVSIRAQTKPSSSDIRPLSLDGPIEREMKGGEVHSYSLTLDAGQFFYIIVDQRSIDVGVTVFGPDGKKLLEVDSLNLWHGLEPVSMIVDATGNYRFDMRSREGAVPGRYLVSVIELRAATEQDKSRVAIEQQLDHAQRLQAEGTAQSMQTAIGEFEEVLPKLRAVGDLYREALTVYAISRSAYDLGQYKKALDYLELTLPFTRMAGYQFGEAEVLANIGHVFSSLGENDKALDYYSQSLPLRRAVRDVNGEAATLSSIAKVNGERGEYQKALDYHQKALPLLRAVGDHFNEGRTLNDIGAMHRYLGENKKALEWYERALLIARALEDWDGEASTLHNIGNIHYHAGEKQKAFNYFIQSLPLRRVVGNRDGEGRTLDSLSYLYGSLGNPRLATVYSKLSANAFQQLRSNAQGLDRDVQKTYLKSVEKIYRSLADLLLSQGRLTEAHQVLNTFKDQQYFDFDQKGSFEPLLQTLRESGFAKRYEQETNELAKLGYELAEFKRRFEARQPNGEEAQELEQLETQFKTASDEFSVFLKQAEDEFSRPLDFKDKIGEVSDTLKLQALLRQLDQETGERTVAVYTLRGENRYYCLLVTSDSLTHVFTPIKGSKLDAKALKLWGLLQSPDYDPRPLSNELYNLILKPIENKLPPSTKTIIWSLDGNIRYVPIAALYDGKRYLVERYNHVIFTRADKERLAQAVTGNWTATAMGTSAAHTVDLLGNRISFGDLPGVGEELRLLFKHKDNPHGLFEGETLQDVRFTKAAMFSALRQKRPLVHIASHFAFRPGDAERSFLLIGDGTALTLAEMKQQERLFDGVEMLTLSACNTAAQQSGANGREVDAFAELAQRLGANAVMATLWSVADSSTPWLMREFYQIRQNHTLNKAEALRRAQLSLLNGSAVVRPTPTAKKRMPMVQVLANDAVRQISGTKRADLIFVEANYARPFKKDPSKPFAHPYYWSPFVLFGNWR